MNFKKIIFMVLKNLAAFLGGGVLGILLLVIFIKPILELTIRKDVGLGIIAVAPAIILIYGILFAIGGGVLGIIVYNFVKFILNRKKVSESLIKFDIYSTDNIPNNKTAKEISEIFIRNYPKMYSEEIRKADCSRYSTFEQIQHQVKNGNFYITAIIGNKIVGMTKFRLENRTNLENSQEWLGSWLIVDEKFRKNDIGEKLFKENIVILRNIKNISGERIFFIADVNKNNSASINFCKKMGCSEEIGKSPEFILFRKEI
jgi:RimJ/RimL family protein N-acetyltransferase